MTDCPKHSKSPKLYEIENLCIPINIEMPPLPIKVKETYDNTLINLYGLPDGLKYDASTGMLIGNPTSCGRHGVLVIAQNNYGFDHIGFVINVIDYTIISTKITKIENQKIQLGQAIEPCRIEVDDQHASICVQGLPEGVLYDPYLEQIVGIPEMPGCHKISVCATNKYSVETVSKFTIQVDGTINPALELTLMTTEQIADKLTNFHNVSDQIIYTFTIKNTGNVTLNNIEIDEPLIGIFNSNKSLVPNDYTIFKYSYCLTQKDLGKENLSISAVASGETSQGIKITTPQVSHNLPIRGHDANSFNIKLIQANIYPKDKLIKCTLSVTNLRDQIINDISINCPPDCTAILDNTRLGSGESLGVRLQYKWNPIKPMITIMGKSILDVPTANMYPLITDLDEKKTVFVKLYNTKYHLKESQPLTMVAHIRAAKKRAATSPTGVVKFYDGNQLLGKANIVNELAILQVPELTLGKHNLYVIYQGDDTYLENGSEFLTVFVGNENTLTNDQISYIRNHVDKFKKNEVTALTLIKSVSK